MSNKDTLPPLPEPAIRPFAIGDCFTADQMHTYAAACILDAHARGAIAAQAPTAQAFEGLAQEPLTDEQILSALSTITHEPAKRLPIGWLRFVRAIEALHGIKGAAK